MVSLSPPMGDDGLGDAALTGDIEGIALPDLVQREVQRIVVFLDVFPDLPFALLQPGKIDGGGDGLGALDAFRMIVGRLGGCLCQHLRLLDASGDPGHRGDPHGTSVAETLIRSHGRIVEPVIETAAVSRVGIFGTEIPHLGAHFLLELRKTAALPVAVQGVGHRDGHDRVIRKTAVRMHQFKVLRLYIMCFKTGTDDVPADRSKHWDAPSLEYCYHYTPVFRKIKKKREQNSVSASGDISQDQKLNPA